MTKKKPITADELLAQLNADPQWVADQAKREDDRRRRAAELARAEAPVVNDLRLAGFAIDSVYDLVNTKSSYPRAVPILLGHLERAYPDVIREGIARALAVPDARVGWDLLIRLYRSEPAMTSFKQGLAVAIANTADDEVIEEVIALARDVRHGESRLLLLRALERSRDPQATEALREFAVDPVFEKEVRVILLRLEKRRRR
jgi:hypothetical protein